MCFNMQLTLKDILKLKLATSEIQEHHDCEYCAMKYLLPFLSESGVFLFKSQKKKEQQLSSRRIISMKLSLLTG